MDDIKKGYRDAEGDAKEAWRKTSPTSSATPVTRRESSSATSATRHGTPPTT